MDCSHICEYADAQVDGYIGNEFLGSFVITFRYGEGCLCLAW